ncbi:ComEA family DNA-binding protein [Ursidibacter sp. B-7004-1]
MKKLTQYAAALLLSAFSLTASAEEKSVSTAPETQTQVQAVQTQAKIANPNAININTATASELQDKLVGIGAKKAQAIVEYREKNGKFLNIEQLTEVSGIGKATLDKNRDRIVLE